MRWRQITIIVAVSLTAACGSKQPELQPSMLDFDLVAIGETSTIDLHVLTLNGQPLANPEFQLLPASNGSGFELLQRGYLGTPSLLVFTPQRENTWTQELLVKAGGETFSVPVSGAGMYAPACPQPEGCFRAMYSFTENKCVVKRMEDGEQCGTGDCDREQLCNDGVCTYTMRKKPPPPLCQQDVPSVTLQPAWSYEAEPDRNLSFSGLADADGNVYLRECPRSGADWWRCDIVSLTADGQRRWRIKASALVADRDYPPGPLIIEGMLFVFGTTKGMNVAQAFRLTDGSLAWQRSGLDMIVPAKPGRVAAVVDKKHSTLDGAVLVLDTETGAELKRLDDVVPGPPAWNVVSDGQGRLYTSSNVYPEDIGQFLAVTSAVSLDQGLLWSARINGGDFLHATDGTRLFTDRAQVIDATGGQSLYANDALFDDFSLNPAQQAIYTADRDRQIPDSCPDANVRRLAVSDGVQQSSCRVRENDLFVRIMTRLIPTRDGGTASLVAPLSIGHGLTQTLFLRWSDADGNAVFRAKLEGLAFRADLRWFGEVAIVKERWVMSGQRPTGETAVVAYDVPGLALAAHGWMGYAGSQARNFAPW